MVTKGPWTLPEPAETIRVPPLGPKVLPLSVDL
jgi:hypothetical protein